MCLSKLSTYVKEFNIVCEFTQHIKLHSNKANYRYQYGVPECSRQYVKIAVLKTHMYRDHKEDVPLRNSQQPCTPIQCNLCTVRCETSSLLVCHLRSHLLEGLHIECPFRGCDRRFSVLSSFASHLSKKHRNDSVEHVENPSNVGRPVASESVSHCEPFNVNYSDDEQEVPVAVDGSLFL